MDEQRTASSQISAMVKIRLKVVVCGKKGIEKMSNFVKTLCAITLAMIVIVGGSLLAIQLCMKLALSSPDIVLLEKSIPLLEKMIWPLFFLMLIFLFKDVVEKILSEVPGLISRSYLPHSPAPYQIEKPTKENIITRADDGQKDDSFNQNEHDIRVKHIMNLLSKEEDVRVTANVKLLETNVVCNGACVVGHEVRYLAVLPKEFKDRIQVVIKRMNVAIQDCYTKKLKAIPTLMICIYGFETSQEADEIDVVDFRRLANCKVVFRFFLKGQLEQNDNV